MDDPQERFPELLLALLREHPEGLSEYDLLGRLKEMGLPVFEELDFADRLALFRAHFLLFHHLYGLRDRLEAERRETIDIHCLRIALRPWRPGVDGLPGPPDPLGRYYRDLANIKETDRRAVEEMLARFGNRLAEGDRLAECLETLGLTAPASREAVKRRFRRLALTHHPDRGGDPGRFRRLRRAAEMLLGKK